jgi:membrane-associated phospholipid phosphatase
LTFDKLTLHLFLNQFHTEFLDVLFPIVTHLGDGITVAVISALLLFVNFRWAFFLGSASLLNSLVVQFLKRGVFEDHFRPFYYFKESEGFHLLEGVEMHERFAFPSGHTAAAFCLYFGLSLLVKNPVIKGALFFVALLASYSRIYLSQHFVEDVLFGSVIGIFLAFIMFVFWSKVRPESRFLNRSILRLS